MSWKEISTQAGADALLKVFGRFHDGCIREAHLWTGHWVGPDLGMCCPGELDTKIRFLVQRQWKGPAAIELVFEEVTRFNLVPSRPNYDSIIYDATLLVQDGLVFWSTEGHWKPDSASKDESTWVSAKRLRWREVPWLGEELHYGPADDEAGPS